MNDRGGPPSTTNASTKRLSRTRRVITWVLVVVVSVMIPLSVVTVWAINTVLNTDRYVATMAPLARNPVITDHVAIRATDNLFSKVQVQQRIANELPKRASSLAPQLTQGLHGFVQSALSKALSSSWFPKLWDAANRRSHQALINILSGESGGGVVTLKNGKEVVIDLNPVLLHAIDVADSKGIHTFDSLKPQLSTPEGRFSITLVTSQQIGNATKLFNFVKKLKWLVPILSLVVLAIAVAIAVDRRKALLRAAVGSAIGVTAVLTGLNVGRHLFVNKAVSQNLSGQVTGIVWDTVLRYLRGALLWTLLVTVLLGVLLWLIGPARYAVLLRGGIAGSARLGASPRGGAGE